jgi:hypothetical protein
MRYQVERSINGQVGGMSGVPDRAPHLDICDVVDMQREVSKRVMCTARRADAVLIAGVLNATDSAHVAQAA